MLRSELKLWIRFFLTFSRFPSFTLGFRNLGNPVEHWLPMSCNVASFLNYDIFVSFQIIIF